MIAERLEGRLVDEVIDGLLEMQVKEPGHWPKADRREETVSDGRFAVTRGRSQSPRDEAARRPRREYRAERNGELTCPEDAIR